MTSFKSLSRDPTLAKAVGGVLPSGRGIVDTLRRRDLLAVERSLNDQASSTSTQFKTLSSNVTGVQEVLEFQTNKNQPIFCFAKLSADGAGNIAILKSFNAASVVISGGNAVLTFEEAAIDTDYVLAGSSLSGNTFVTVASQTLTTVTIRLNLDTGGQASFAVAPARTVFVQLFGGWA